MMEEDVQTKAMRRFWGRPNPLRKWAEYCYPEAAQETAIRLAEEWLLTPGALKMFEDSPRTVSNALCDYVTPRIGYELATQCHGEATKAYRDLDIFHASHDHGVARLSRIYG